MLKESFPQAHGPEDEKESDLAKLREQLRQSEEREAAIAQLLGRVGEIADKEHMTAARDNLTGLLNRKGFQEAFEELISPKEWNAEEKRSIPEEFTVLLLDLDNFKEVNDTYGHTEGDKVLKAAANYLQEHFRRANDKVERFGGEEFLVLLSGPESKTILEKLDGKPFPVEIKDKNGDPVTIEVSFSGGITNFKPTWTDLKEAVVVADRALYMAKESGRNKILSAQEEEKPISS